LGDSNCAFIDHNTIRICSFDPVFLPRKTLKLVNNPIGALTLAVWLSGFRLKGFIGMDRRTAIRFFGSNLKQLRLLFFCFGDNLRADD